MATHEPQASTHRRSSSSIASGSAGAAEAHPALAEHRVREDSEASDIDLDELLDSGDEALDDDEETGLTHTERKERRRHRKRGALLDERFAGEAEPGGGGSKDGGQTAQERLARASVVRDILINAILIGLWYSFSISISVYNKWMFSAENLDFHFPLFTTSLHMLIQFSLAASVLYFVPSLRPGRSQKSPPQSSQPGAQPEYTSLDPNQPKPPLMTRWFYLTRISPCSTATALDIGLGNFSLRFISLTFFTMCKSSVLAFVLLFAFVFRLEQPTWRLCLIIAFMTVGVIMMVAGETAFNALGFILVITASFCSGLRWSLTQILLLRNPATSNPFSSIFFLTPVMFLALIILALPIEGPAKLVAGFHTLSAEKGLPLSILLVLFPGVLAFLMVAAEFALLKRTSVVTLSVCGIFKEVLTISAAGMAFGDELSPINISGLLVTIASIAAYNYLKYYNMRQVARKEAQETLEQSGGTGH